MSAKDRQVGGDHYRQLEIQPGVFAEKNRLTGYESNVIKYVCRHRYKGDGRGDLLKAIHYLELLIEENYPEVDHKEDTVYYFKEGMNYTTDGPGDTSWKLKGINHSYVGTPLAETKFKPGVDNDTTNKLTDGWAKRKEPPI